MGDPLDESNYLGPVFNLNSAMQIEESLNLALEKGANLLCGGKRIDAMIEPTVFEVTEDSKEVFREEIFGPVIPLFKFSDEYKLLDEVNSTAYGLQCGVFTESISRAKRVFKKINVGTVILNDGSAFRADHFPFGGVKASGFGREGIKYAMEEMSVLKTLVW